MNRALLGILTRVLLVVFTFVLIVALAPRIGTSDRIDRSECVQEFGEVGVQALLEMGASE